MSVDATPVQQCNGYAYGYPRDSHNGHDDDDAHALGYVSDVSSRHITAMSMVAAIYNNTQTHGTNPSPLLRASVSNGVPSMVDGASPQHNSGAKSDAHASSPQSTPQARRYMVSPILVPKRSSSVTEMSHDSASGGSVLCLKYVLGYVWLKMCAVCLF